MKTPTLVGAIISYFYYFFNVLYYFIYGYGTDFVEKSIKSKELKVQIHKSITKDGCQIFSHQILPKIKNDNNDKLIFCQHGFFETGATYTIYNNSLAIKLAELGYEVWIGHNRGSSFGQTSSEYDEYFWDYNIDHIIEFDLLCQIQKMFEISGKKKFAFVGQSQGGTQIMGLLNHHPMYIDQIAFLCMISPAIIIRDPNNFLVKFLMSVPPSNYGKKEFLKLLHYGQKSLPGFITKITRDLVMKSLGLINQSCTADSIAFKSVPEGCVSVQHAIHWFQMLNAPGVFRKFDHDSYWMNNYTKKNQTESYKLDCLHQIPSLYVLAGLDPVIDNESIIKEFSQTHPIHVEEDYSHLDFTWNEEGCEKLFSNFQMHLEKSAKW